MHFLFKLSEFFCQLAFMRLNNTFSRFHIRKHFTEYKTIPDRHFTGYWSNVLFVLKVAFKCECEIVVGNVEIVLFTKKYICIFFKSFTIKFYFDLRKVRGLFKFEYFVFFFFLFLE